MEHRSFTRQGGEDEKGFGFHDVVPGRYGPLNTGLGSDRVQGQRSGEPSAERRGCREGPGGTPEARKGVRDPAANPGCPNPTKARAPDDGPDHRQGAGHGQQRRVLDRRDRREGGTACLANHDPPAIRQGLRESDGSMGVDNLDVDRSWGLPQDVPNGRRDKGDAVYRRRELQLHGSSLVRLHPNRLTRNGLRVVRALGPEPTRRFHHVPRQPRILCGQRPDHHATGSDPRHVVSSTPCS